ncbi:MAG: class I SAM-dependent methyltransferase [Gemmatimonadaceae bacterium]
MNARDAVRLIAGAIPKDAGHVWADFGAGDGIFTRALITLLGRDAHVYAVDVDAAALASIDPSTQITKILADLATPLTLPSVVDGAVIANTLHFMRDAGAVLAQLVTHVKPGGRVVIIEYDRRNATRWVPYPLPPSRLASVAESAGLSAPVIAARRPSAYQGELYVAAADRLSTINAR